MAAPRMDPRKLQALAFTAVALCVAGCTSRPTEQPFRLRVRVEGEPGRPLAGARVAALGAPVGQTGDAGVLELRVRGTEGERIPVAVTCPEGYRSPDRPVDAVLHGLADPAGEAQYDFQCAPLLRTLAIVVRADHGPRLPVFAFGREVARTDDSGAAHVLLQAAANEDVLVTLSTAEPGSERLRPQSPSMLFPASDRAPYKVFNASFQLEPEKARAYASRPAPIRLN